MKFYTIAQAAKMLRVSEKTIRNYIHSGKLVAHRMTNSGSSRWMIYPEDMEALKASMFTIIVPSDEESSGQQ